MIPAASPPSAEPFFFPGDDRGALLIHGFTGTPHEMRLLGEELSELGLTVLGVRLAGHGGSVTELEQTRWPDWLASCERGLVELERWCTTIHLVGFSLGGALSLLLARQNPETIASLTLLAAPLWLPAHYQLPLRWLERLGLLERLRSVRKLVRGDLRDSGQRRGLPTTPAYPLRATLSLHELLQRVRPEVEQIRCPTLLLHSRRDHTVPYACSSELLSRLPRARRVTLHRSFHVLPLDVERQQVSQEITRFLQES